jgi:hypothetical protein
MVAAANAGDPVRRLSSRALRVKHAAQSLNFTRDGPFMRSPTA